MGSSTPPDGRAALVAGLRRFAKSRGAPSAPVPAGVPALLSLDESVERCDFCSAGLSAQHRHMLDVEERRILCACETCLVRQADQPRYRPTGRRLLALDDFELSDDIWSRFQIPVGLAFFLYSGLAGRVIALYPSPLGATESELDLAAWEKLADTNPVLRELEPDAEALIVGRNLDVPQHFIAPIDECYRLVGLIKTRWQGISGGSGADEAIAEFFAELRARTAA